MLKLTIKNIKKTEKKNTINTKKFKIIIKS